jgi:hypothetical protein
MFIITDGAQLRNAKERAEEIDPAVFVVAFGSYEVEGSAGNRYAVTVKTFGHRTGVDCACIAGQYGNACYHAVAALNRHALLATTGAPTPAAARDKRLALLESDLRFISRRLYDLEGNYEIADDIYRAVRSARQSLGEYEIDLAAPEIDETGRRVA